MWARPGLDRRSRSIVTLTALMGTGYNEELGMHVKAALRNGLTEAEIAEVLLNAGVCCGFPSANGAFAEADKALGHIASQPGHHRDD